MERTVEGAQKARRERDHRSRLGDERGTRVRVLSIHGAAVEIEPGEMIPEG